MIKIADASFKEDIARSKKFHETFRFIDELCVFNDGREFKSHTMKFETMKSGELVLKLKYSGCHATFRDFNIALVNGKISAKLYDKRDIFPFFIVRMPNFHSSIPSYIYGTVMPEILLAGR